MGNKILVDQMSNFPTKNTELKEANNI